MKRTTAFLCLLLFLTMLVGCGQQAGDDTLTCEKIAASLDRCGTFSTLTVRAEGDAILNAVYTATVSEDTTTVAYEYEEIATFSESEDGQIVIPPAYMTKKTGSVTCRGGATVSQTGELPPSDIPALLSQTFPFSGASVTDVRASESEFEAKLTDAAAFLAVEGVTDLRVKVTFRAGELSDLQLTYLLDGDTRVTRTYHWGA